MILSFCYGIRASKSIFMASETELSQAQPAQSIVAAGSAQKNVLKTFAQQMTLKLDDNNYLSWKQQVEGIIRTHKLQRHVVNPAI
ncbi:histone deacetylase, partial [Trifolium medium]|nr:histone deacetylase [Trifolium medium]